MAFVLTLPILDPRAKQPISGQDFQNNVGSRANLLLLLVYKALKERDLMNWEKMYRNERKKKVLRKRNACYLSIKT